MVSDERYGFHRSLVDCFDPRAGDSLFVFVAAALAIASRLLQDRDGLRVMLYLLLAVRTGAPDGMHGNRERVLGRPGSETPLAQMRRMAYSARVPEGDRLGLECQ